MPSAFSVLNNTAGGVNSFFGTSAGKFNTSGGANTFVGYFSGASNTIENQNTFIGTESNGAAGVTNSTAIGAHAKATASNSLVLGSINGVNGATADTNVGIGTTAPTQRLSVNGNVEIMGSGNKLVGANGDVTFTGNLGDGSGGLRSSNVGSVDVIIDSDNNDTSRAFRVMNNGADRSTATTLLAVTDGGNVGIGTTAPAHRLTIGIGTNTAPTSAQLAVFGASGAFATVRDTTSNVQALFGADSTTIDGVSGTSIYGSTTAHGVSFRVNNSTQMAIAPSGNVGIGTTAPKVKLHITAGHLYLETQQSGIILRATDGTKCFILTVNNLGFLGTSQVACP